MPRFIGFPPPELLRVAAAAGAGKDAVRRVRLFYSDVLGEIVRAFCRRTETFFTETSSSSSIAGTGMIVVRRFGQYAIVRVASSSSSSIASVASLPAVLSPHPLQRLPSEVSIGTACMWAYTLAAGLYSRSLP